MVKDINNVEQVYLSFKLRSVQGTYMSKTTTHEAEQGAGEP